MHKHIKESEQMKIVYGPVPSWRLGRSLGIDVTLPPKTCTFNCVYCQLGPTIRHVSTSENIRFNVTAKNLAEELSRKIREINVKTLDFVTFSGTGEPTLNPNLGDLITTVKKLLPGISVAVLTNSSLINLQSVRKALMKADLVAAKLDAGDQQTFKSINRPAKGVPNIDKIIEGIKEFKKGYRGILALQVMLIKSEDPSFRANTEGEAFQKLIEVIKEVEPDQVELNTPLRPPSEKHVEPVSTVFLEKVVKTLSDTIGGENIFAVGIREAQFRPKKVFIGSRQQLEKEILEMLKRRPCRIKDISIALGVNVREIEECIKVLMQNRRMKVVESKRGTFYYVR